MFDGEEIWAMVFIVCVCCNNTRIEMGSLGLAHVEKLDASCVHLQ